CGKHVQVRRSRCGAFGGWSGYRAGRHVRRDQDRAEATPRGDKCRECGQGELVERRGRVGPFVACNRYPDCKYRTTKGKDGRVKARAEAKVLDEACPVCGKPMVERQGRYGPFKSCSDYPRCKGPQRA